MEDSTTQKVPAAVERFIKQLVVTFKAVVLYPAASSIPKENAVEAIKLLGVILQDRPEMRLTVQKEGLAYRGHLIFEGQPAYESFARELYNRGLSEIRFHSGVEFSQLTGFLGVLKSTPEEIASAGGFEQRMWEVSVDSITVKEAAAGIVDSIRLPGKRKISRAGLRIRPKSTSFLSGRWKVDLATSDCLCGSSEMPRY